METTQGKVLYLCLEDNYSRIQSRVNDITAEPVSYTHLDVYKRQTDGYELAQAVKDGFLVDYVSVESKLKFIEQGIVYDLSLIHI